MTPSTGAKPLSPAEFDKLYIVLKTAQRGDYLDNAFCWYDIEQMLATISALQTALADAREDIAMRADSIKRADDDVNELRAALATAQGELKVAGEAVRELVPLGGSECFKRAGDGFTVDIPYVVAEFNRRHRDMFKCRMEAVRARKQAESDLTDQRARADRAEAEGAWALNIVVLGKAAETHNAKPGLSWDDAMKHAHEWTMRHAPAASSLLAEHERLKGNQRTAGTVEVCQTCSANQGDDGLKDWRECPQPKCPIRSAIASTAEAFTPTQDKAGQMSEAITAFLAKWDQVRPAIDGAFVQLDIRGMGYQWPTLESELKGLRDSVVQLEGTNK